MPKAETGALAGQSIHVLGGGMVGVCTALELQSRGARVTLVDRREPGRETSWGNAGVMARSSLIPLNNPTLWRSLPGLLSNRRTALRYDLRYLLKNPIWTLGFLANARSAVFDETTAALDGLIQLSIGIHRHRIAQVGQLHRLSEAGWLTLYRSEAGFERARPLRDVMNAFDIDTVLLKKGEIQDLEPSLKPVFDRAVWVRDSASVDDPGAIVAAYAERFAQAGGKISRAEVVGIQDDGENVRLRCVDGIDRTCDRAVICLGPWARDLMETMGYRVRLGFERGYHRHFGGAPNGGLHRPIHDSAGGFVLSPMERGLRLSTGVELCAWDAAPNTRQMDQAETAARQAIELGEALDPDFWLGSRPTFPDSRPAIGPVPNTRNVWACFGHQHIGFSTGPGSARILADLMEGRAPSISAAPFRPDRFIRAR
jgi:D-amino-acid dehydrogenase